MALILKGFVKLYYFLNEDIADTRTQDWPLMATPWPGLALLAFYLLTVLKWLPNYMEKRTAYDPRKLIVFYNAFQIICCAYVSYQVLRLAWINDYALVCQPVDEGPNGVEMAWKVCYAYFIIKILDLLDTIFFVIRKKQNQVSFLHVYHHCGMVMVSWGIVKYLPGGHITFLILVNSVVHVIMYGYYLLTVWDEAYKQSVWWKKYVTQIQILQFTLLLLHFLALVLMPNCGFPREPAYIMIPQNLFIVILFSDFYYHTYIKTKPVPKVKTN